MQKIFYGTLIIFSIVLFGGFFLVSHIYAQSSATVETTVIITICGNNLQETGEECDGTDLAGLSCINKGFTGGALSCSASCEFNTSSCTTGGGGGGGGGVSIIPTSVRFTGKAYPNSTITILKDAQVAGTTVAGLDANFELKLSGLASGNYVFSIYGEDNQGTRSGLLTFPISIASGTGTTVSGIFIVPTIDVNKSEVKLGDTITIFGQSYPGSDILINVSSEQDFFVRIPASTTGVYVHQFDTTPLNFGSHFAKSKSTAPDQTISAFGKAVGFTVGTQTVIKTVPKFGVGDLNDDGRVNIVDFSIAAFWYKRVLSFEFSPKEKERLNGDGKIDLVDFSIMAFHWTG